MIITCGFFILMMSFNLVFPMIIGHRGACGYEPENTLASFEKAIDLGVSMVEFDVFLCKSGEVVVIHDATVDRTTNGTGKVSDLTLDQLKQLDAGNGQRIVTLSELFDCIDRRVLVDIELKGVGTAEPTIAIINRYIAKGWQYNDFIITSDDHHELCIAKQICPDIAIGAVLSSMIIECGNYMNQLGFDVAIISTQMMRDWFLDDLRKAHIPIWVYTVNDPEEMQDIVSENIAAIFSDYPDRIKNALPKRCRELSS